MLCWYNEKYFCVNFKQPKVYKFGQHRISYGWIHENCIRNREEKTGLNTLSEQNI